MTTNCWDDPAEYPHPKTTKPVRWAWEFLRRNPGYLADWKRFVAPRIGAGYDPNDGELLEEFDTALPPEEGGYTFSLAVHRIPKVEAVTAMKYGIDRLWDPGCDEPVRLEWETGKITVYGEFLTKAYGQGDDMRIRGCRGSAITPEGCYRLPISAEKAYVEFNFTLPIDEQLKRVKQVLKGLQADFKRRHPELVVSNKRNRGEYFLAYLQLLDAERLLDPDGAGLREDVVDDMAALLPKDLELEEKGSDLQKAVTYSLDRAKWFRDVGYRYLLLMPHKKNKTRS